jgi:ABC-type uncharacterized transport system ATPase subunit
MTPSLRVSNITKRFGAITALDDVSLTFDPGKIHALLGENGAGKSTIAKCILGLQTPDAGRIEIDGTEVAMNNADVAQSNGIGMVHQHYSLVPSLTVLENFVLAKRDREPIIDWVAERKICEDRLRDLPFMVDLSRLVSQLSAGEKQRIEIIKQLLLETRILILDEPTSVLTPQEADEILSFVRLLVRDCDRTAIFITHKLREVIAYADVLHVLRKGRLVAEGAVSDYTADDLAIVMVGEAVTRQVTAKRSDASPSGILSIEGLTALDQRGAKALQGVDLTLNSGEILGIAGVSGNGQQELMEVLCGQRPPLSGRIAIAGSAYNATRKDQARLGLRLLPEEPIHNAGIGDMTVAENLLMRSYDRAPFSKLQFLRPGILRAAALAMIEKYAIQTPGPEAPLSILSGGNIQRVMLAREITPDTKVLAIANPCHGLDIKAIASVHERLIDLRRRGCAVLLISEDLDEILALSDRIAVMYEGRVVSTLDRSEADRTHIGKLMTGHEMTGHQ